MYGFGTLKQTSEALNQSHIAVKTAHPGPAHANGKASAERRSTTGLEGHISGCLFGARVL